MVRRLVMRLLHWAADKLDCRLLAQAEWDAALKAVEAIHKLTYRSGSLSQRSPHAVRKIRRYVRDARKALGAEVCGPAVR